MQNPSSSDTNYDGAGASPQLVVGNPLEEVQAVELIWDIVRAIPTDEDQITCWSKKGSQTAVVSWASNTNPEDIWHVC